MHIIPRLFASAILLASVFTLAQQPSAPVPYTSANQLNTLLGNLDEATQSALTDLGKVRVDRWKADSGVKRQSQSDIDSIVRNLQSALPGMVNELRAAPEDLAATFKLYHNLDALHDVFRSVAESAGAFGSKSEYQSLAADSDGLDSVRRTLAERLQNLAVSKDAEIARLRAQVKTAQASAPATPKKIVIDDDEPAKKPKKKAVPKPAIPPAAQAQPAPK